MAEGETGIAGGRRARAVRAALILAFVLLLCGCVSQPAAPTPHGQTATGPPATISAPAPTPTPSYAAASPSSAAPPAPPAPPPSPTPPAAPPEECPPAPWNVSFADLDQVAFITPLGGVAVGSPGRTYVHVVPGENGGRNLVDLRMPTDGALKRVVWADRGERAQWRLEFDLPCQRTLVLDHLEDVPDAVRAVGPATPSTSTGDVRAVNVPFHAGDFVGRPNGTAAMGGAVFDLYLLDWTYTVPHANLSRWKTEHYVHAVCPYDAFAPPLRDAMYAKFAAASGSSFTPDCRSASRDVAGTLSGAWFVGDADDRGERLALAADFDGVVDIVVDHASGMRESHRVYAPTTDPAAVGVGQTACWAVDGGWFGFRLETATQLRFASGMGPCPAGLPPEAALYAR